jgi:outer membrane protein assembly factor BamA
MKGQSYNVQLHSVDNNEALLQKEAQLPVRFSSDVDINDYLLKLVPALQSKGYLAASIDSVSIKQERYDVYVYLGLLYKWAQLRFDSIPQVLWTETGINPQQWSDRALNPQQLASLSEKLLRWCENNGYPFARVWLGGLDLDEKAGISGMLMLQRGELRKIDSLHIEGNVGVSKGYLERYLDIFEGSNYSEKKLRNISARLRELPFLQESAPWQLAFKLTDTRLKLFLKPKRANQLNAIIGLIPNSVQTGKFLLTADATLALQNIFGYGESVAVTYQNLQYRSPKVNADLVWPYLLNSPIGIDAHFSLFKRDTTFSRSSLQAGLRYQLNATDYLRLFYQDMHNHLITVDTAYIRQYKRLPDNADVSADGGGLEIVLNRTDYRLNPRKGWQLRLSSSALLRRVQRSDAVTALTDLSGFDYATLYDSLEQQRYQYRAEGSLAGYFPLGKKTTLMCAYNAAWVSGRYLFQNELYQVGGFKLLRGFDEQSVYANQYHILTLEMRLLLDRNSYVYLFSDNGYVQGYYNSFGREGIYNGFGLGTTLETKTGLFTISYALGRSDTQALQFKQSKIHFGYLAYF